MPAPFSVSYAHDNAELAQIYEACSDFQYEHGKCLVADLNLQDGERVLDLGAGTGRLARHIAELVGPTGEVVAVEPLRERLALARTRAVENLRIVEARAEDLTLFPDNHFDAVVLNSVLHWIADQNTAMLQIRRVLKPAGRLALNSADPLRPHDYVTLLAEALKQHGVADPVGLVPPHRVNETELLKLLVETGFEQIQITAVSFNDQFEDLDHLLRWNQSSYFGNFLPDLDFDGPLLISLRDALSAKTGAHGVILNRHLVFAWACKPSIHDPAANALPSELP
jgi:arsenite methyltransferase